MDLVDLMHEKRFLGEEFLTWIWFQSEINSGLIDLPGMDAVEVWFEDRLSLEAGSGDAKQVVSCHGKEIGRAEARTALREGKKISQARIRLQSEGSEWRLTVKAEGFELSGIRAPKSLEPEEEEPEGKAGLLLDRVAVIQELTRIFDSLFAGFLLVRLTENWAKEELPRLRRWLKEDSE